MVNKKAIVLSSSAMRFHVGHGWTEELLNKYLVNGSFHRMAGWPAVGISDYYILNVGSRLDVNKLCSDGHVGELLGKDCDDLRGKSDVEILETRNW